MYTRSIGDRTHTFDFAEGLIKDNLLFVDRETNSVWSQLHGYAIHGPLENTPLRVVPAMQTTWAFWRERHPDTRVMVDDQPGRPYLYRNRQPGSPRPATRPTSHDTSLLGLGLTLGGESMFFPFDEMAKVQTPIDVKVGGTDVVVYFSPRGLTAWAEKDGELLPTVLAYEFGWRDFYPRTRVFQSGASSR